MQTRENCKSTIAPSYHMMNLNKLILFTRNLCEERNIDSSNKTELNELCKKEKESKLLNQGAK